jgi:hypothetical protein
MARCRPEWRRFLGATQSVAETQWSVLRENLSRNRDTEFGRRHGFDTIRCAREYGARVPLGSAAGLAAAVERIAGGARAVLTAESVLCLQPTSGSTQGEKLIPSTPSLRREFQRAVAAWIGNLYRERPAVRAGRAYWSISPALGPPRRTSAGLPIGFEDDTAYLGLAERWLANAVLAAPPALARQLDVERFRHATLLHLLGTRDLALVSVWSPTFFSALLDMLPRQAPALIRDLHDGTSAAAAGATRRRPDRGRALELEALMARAAAPPEICRTLWPQLALVSCWMDGPSRLFADRLQAQCGAIEFQPKGLLATEACVTFPVVGAAGCVLAIRSHFLEFLPAGESGRSLLAHELDVGGRYDVVVTTGGGLYRYPLGDTIEIVGRLNDCPLARFVGRGHLTSDLVGEKLHDSFVQECIARALRSCGVSATYAALAAVAGRDGTGPEAAQERCRYRLLLEAANDAECAALAETLDQLLRANVHYGYARDLAQLGPIELVRLPGPPGTAWAAYERTAAAGRLLGGLKPLSILPAGHPSRP